MDSIRMGVIIAEKRKAKQMTQQELADRLHISNKTISKWESCRSMPDVSILPALAQALGCTAAEFLGDGESGEQPATSDKNPQALDYLADREFLRYRIAKTVFAFVAAAGVLIDLVAEDPVRLLLGCLFALLSLTAYEIAKAVINTHMKGLDRFADKTVERPSDRCFLLGMVWLWLYPFVCAYTQLGWWFFESRVIENLFAWDLPGGEVNTTGFFRLWIAVSLVADVGLLIVKKLYDIHKK